MARPYAITPVRLITAFGDAPVATSVIKSKARHGAASFHAPNWHPMAFRTVESALTNIARHPGFVGWAVKPAGVAL